MSVAVRLLCGDHVVASLRVTMTKKLSDAENLKLVQLYREHECLWDNKSINYRNRDMRATALQSIAQELSVEEIGPSEVKNKIKSLRATYILELEKIKKSSRLGAGGNVYIPKVRWFEEMDAFIRNVSIQRKTTDSSDTPNNIPVSGDDDEEETRSNAENNNTANSPASESGPTTPRPRSKRSKLSQMLEMIKDIKNVTHSINMPPDEEKDCDIYGKHVASQLKKLSEEQCVIAQAEIQKILAKCRLADIEKRRRNVNIYQNTHFPMASTSRAQPHQNRYTPSPASTTNSGSSSSLGFYPPDVPQMRASINSSLGFYPNHSTQIAVPSSSTLGHFLSSQTQSPRYLVDPSQVIITNAPHRAQLNDNVECESDSATEVIKYAFDTA